MTRLLERDDAARERGSAIQRIEGGSEAGGSGAGDDYFTSLRTLADRSSTQRRQLGRVHGAWKGRAGTAIGAVPARHARDQLSGLMTV